MRRFQFRPRHQVYLLLFILMFCMVVPAHADPVSEVMLRFEDALTGVWVKSLAVICMTIAFLTMAFGSGQHKYQIATAMLGIGCALAVPSFISSFLS